MASRGWFRCGIEERLVENPLHGVVEEGEERFVESGAIEPEMHTSDGRGAKAADIRERGIALENFRRQKAEKRIMRNGTDAGIGANLGAVVELKRMKSAVGDANAAHGGAAADFPSLALDGDAAAGVEIAERNGGNAENVAAAAGEEGLPENVDAVTSVGAIELFIERADKDDAPEARDGFLRLAVAAKPVEHGGAAGIRGTPAGARDGQKAAGDGLLVAIGEGAEAKKRKRHVERRRKKGRVNRADTAGAVGKEEAVVMPNFRFRANAAIEIGKIGAAAERDVLAIVDVAAVGKGVGSGAAAKVRALFEETDADAGLSEGQGGRQARQSAADHVHGFEGHSFPQAIRCAPARESRPSPRS